MPPLPKPPARGRRPRYAIESPEVAQAIVMVLEGRSNLNGKASGAQLYVDFARAVRRWFEESPTARQEFIEWYERL